jgi:hypothetical protein
MFGGLIRRKGVRCTEDELADESTLFSLTTDVPRPTDRRTDERLLALLPIAKLVTEQSQDLCRIKNISAGGLHAEATREIPSGTAVYVELAFEQRIPGQVVWTRGTSLGVKFDNNVDLRELLANRKPRAGYRPRPPRLEITCGATVKIGKMYHNTQVSDISLGGLKVALHDWECVGKAATVAVESLRPIEGRVRWYKTGMAGILFDKPLRFEELAEWMGKRLEVASLRTGAWDRNRH